MPPEVLSMSSILTPILAQADAGASSGALPGGPWLAWWKILLVLLVAVIWAKLLLWMDKDSDNARMPREGINSGMWAAYAAGLLLVVLLPFFPLAFAAFAGLMLVSVGVYLAWRKQVVGLEDIPEQLKGFFKELFTFRRRKGPKKEKEEALPELGVVRLLNAKGDAPPVPEENDPKRAGYETAHRVLADPMGKGADRIALVPVKGTPTKNPDGTETSGDRYATKYSVDGHDYAGNAFDEASASAAVAFLKDLAGLDAGERRKVQKGKLKARTAGGNHEIQLVTSGTRQGEQVTFDVDPKDRYRQKATALGMSQHQRDHVAEAVDEMRGLVIAAAPAGGGLDALFYGLILEHDSFTQHILTAEREVQRELEGVTQQVIEGTDAEEERKQYSWIADQQPDVFAADRVTGKAAAGELLRALSDGGKRVYVGCRAPDTASASAWWAKTVGDPKRATNPLRLVVAGRVMRKLCDACKVPYEPGEAALAKMGVPKGKVTTLYKARTEPMLDQRGNPVPCNFCGGLGYDGRIGAYEVLPLLDDASRATLAKDPSAATVRHLLRAAKLPTLNEAALRHVVAGNTDLAEVQRAMAAGADKKPRKAAPAAPKAPAAQQPRPAAAAATA